MIKYRLIGVSTCIVKEQIVHRIHCIDMVHGQVKCVSCTEPKKLSLNEVISRLAQELECNENEIEIIDRVAWSYVL